MSVLTEQQVLGAVEFLLVYNAVSCFPICPTSILLSALRDLVQVPTLFRSQRLVESHARHAVPVGLGMGETVPNLHETPGIPWSSLCCFFGVHPQRYNKFVDLCHLFGSPKMVPTFSGASPGGFDGRLGRLYRGSIPHWNPTTGAQGWCEDRAR